MLALYMGKVTVAQPRPPRCELAKLEATEPARELARPLVRSCSLRSRSNLGPVLVIRISFESRSRSDYTVQRMRAQGPREDGRFSGDVRETPLTDADWKVRFNGIQNRQMGILLRFFLSTPLIKPTNKLAGIIQSR